MPDIPGNRTHQGIDVVGRDRHRKGVKSNQMFVLALQQTLVRICSAQITLVALRYVNLIMKKK